MSDELRHAYCSPSVLRQACVANRAMLAEGKLLKGCMFEWGLKLWKCLKVLRLSEIFKSLLPGWVRGWWWGIKKIVPVQWVQWFNSASLIQEDCNTHTNSQRMLPQTQVVNTKILHLFININLNSVLIAGFPIYNHGWLHTLPGIIDSSNRWVFAYECYIAFLSVILVSLKDSNSTA